ncbi:hypothetical protein UB37_19745 [Photobacterium iliopiscarium]|uniref:HEPN AbiU2-like domain-containing protein n=1 Tax=Photobacterium iliopiscarium TaxID=56192 RepID=A0ABX5GX41_9GAMM|nr:hypothetical protein UB37_19745 [Photobacterium iliopiscarium]PSW99379.1 hypothetical protein C9J52_03220 [Photobacterium iliopiscarium]
MKVGMLIKILLGFRNLKLGNFMTIESKREHYKDLMQRMNNAHNNKYYLEASWFAYTVLEDRLLSALRQSGGATYANFKPIKMLGKKMQEIRLRKANDQLLAVYFNDALMDKIHAWKEKRNDLTHAMADGTKTMTEIDRAAYLLSMDGKKLVKDTSNAARLLKKNREKVTA